MTLAMHMADQLLNVPTAAATLALAAVVLALAAAAARRRLSAERLPLMGVMGAFVFAGQMINFTLPGMPGTSGHLGGGVLLAIVLGPAAGIVTMAAILIVQCLIFQDGGLLALGCNIINMGVLPCLAGWGFYRLLLGSADRARPWRQYVAAWAGCIVGVSAGAALVPLEAAVSGVLAISLTDFLAVMVGVHLIIGFVEGLITFAVVAYLRQVRPSAVGLSLADTSRARVGLRPVLAMMLVTALLLGGVVSWFASTHEDGLEWALARPYGPTEGALRSPDSTVSAVSDWHAAHAPMPDYTLAAADAGEEAWPAVDGWRSLAGLLGTLVTLGIVYVLAVLLRRRGEGKPVPPAA